MWIVDADETHSKFLRTYGLSGTLSQWKRLVFHNPRTLAIIKEYIKNVAHMGDQVDCSRLMTRTLDAEASINTYHSQALALETRAVTAENALQRCKTEERVLNAQTQSSPITKRHITQKTISKEGTYEHIIDKFLHLKFVSVVVIVDGDNYRDPLDTLVKLFRTWNLNTKDGSTGLQVIVVARDGNSAIDKYKPLVANGWFSWCYSYTKGNDAADVLISVITSKLDEMLDVDTNFLFVSNDHFVVELSEAIAEYGRTMHVITKKNSTASSFTDLIYDAINTYNTNYMSKMSDGNGADVEEPEVSA